MNNKPIKKEDQEKLFPNDGLINFDPMFQKIRDRRHELWLKSYNSKRKIINEKLANTNKK